MHILSLEIAEIVARVCLVVTFPFSGLDKIVHWNDALKQANSSFLPGGAALLLIAIMVELAPPFCIVIGWHDWLAASVLAAFCVVTALLYHPFWKYSRFWSGTGEGRSHFWDFLKNFAVAGGFLVLATGGTAYGVTHLIRHPLASSHPYSSVPADLRAPDARATNPPAGVSR